jgi:hypothetical protein
VAGSQCPGEISKFPARSANRVGLDRAEKEEVMKFNWPEIIIMSAGWVWVGSMLPRTYKAFFSRAHPAEPLDSAQGDVVQ